MIAVYKKGVIEDLQDLASYNFQKTAWLASSGPIVSSFSEDYCKLFDDTGLGDALDAGQIVFNNMTDRVLRDLDATLRKINANRSPQEILDDPLMQVVREKAAEALRLIRES